MNRLSSAVTNLSIATRQQLYMIDAVTPGCPFFLPHGTRIFNKLVSFMKLKQRQYGFEEVITPLIYRRQLWETSGHWDNYKDDMFRVEGNDLSKEEYGLKPMNCPGHCMVFARFDRSYNELPIRLSDFSSLHRNESSGSLSGLTRVRRFHQDDGHIFCTKSQVHSEITNSLKMIDECYKVFQVPEYKLLLSTRPEEYIGELEEWNVAEDTLKSVLESTGREWTINEGDGAFYGPKIDVILKDNLGKDHQAATIQLDFQLPHRFQLKYQNDINELDSPIMIHRAVFGSLERFFAILMDHYNGKWPFWLSPRQAVIIPVSDKHREFAQSVSNMINDNDDFESKKFYIDIDEKNETVGHRIKECVQRGYTYIIMIGDKELESGQVAIRRHDERKPTMMTPEQVRGMFIELDKTHA
ncbi:thrS [Cyberlindnera jadinii]|uniref:threonine--tRNA ligase n=1 Tax=Cyberlindnera jadinii (strain ATCC 18201 / CBS 1600 / BCRC 20928 / JCM 3617 / NBRC 0987 / NRRL Y-1542) TaxID=983966 RepID=A0A0H5C430_CYBJN|nr:mitochondrial threonyl-tRNA synthetase [Cyberlindnera jadinii NRRL Y-1542]ODV75342.1 mitochondrial threonyl-tRNA synthetase [Cyberlindnera jadinii NRRL Y-1542]CEP22487.1 thrS [Cyberlindnera jadinii]